MDSFFGIGIAELFFIAIIALVVLGPERLPGTIREVSKFFRQIRNISNELSSQFSEEFQALDEINPKKLLRELTEDFDDDDNKNAKRAVTKPGSVKTGSTKTGAVAATAAKATTRPSTSSTTSSASKAPKPVAKAASTTTATTTVNEKTAPASATAQPVTPAVPESTVGDTDVKVSPTGDINIKSDAPTGSGEDSPATEPVTGNAASRAALRVNGKSAEPKDNV
jgi:sec-independent protein translocase protein TatB